MGVGVGLVFVEFLGSKYDPEGGRETIKVAARLAQYRIGCVKILRVRQPCCLRKAPLRSLSGRYLRVLSERCSGDLPKTDGETKLFSGRPLLQWKGKAARTSPSIIFLLRDPDIFKLNSQRVGTRFCVVCCDAK